MAHVKKQERNYPYVAYATALGGAFVNWTMDETKSQVAADAHDAIATIQADEKLGVSGQVRAAGKTYVGAQGECTVKERRLYTNAELVAEQHNIVALREQKGDVTGTMVFMGGMAAMCLYAAAHEAFANSAILATAKAAPGKWGREWLAHTAQFDRHIS